MSVAEQPAVLPATLPGLRSSLFAGLATTITLCAHVTAGGMLPALGQVWFPLLVVWVLHRIRVAGEEQTGWRLVLWLLAAQLTVHLSLPSIDVLMPASGGHAHHPPGGPPLPLQMLVTHLVAATLLGMLLRHGEASIWVLARILGTPLCALRRLGRACTVPVRPADHLVPSRSRLSPVPREPARGAWVLLLGAQAWRGPPSGLVAPA
jgi:hypothetical protein